MDHELKKVLILSVIIFSELLYIGVAFLYFSPVDLSNSKNQQDNPLGIVSINLNTSNNKDKYIISAGRKKPKKQKKSRSIGLFDSAPSYNSDSSSSGNGKGKQFNDNQKNVFSTK